MIRGPIPNGRTVGPTFLAKVEDAYRPAPEWLCELARLADLEGLTGAAQRIGYSKSVVSTVLNGKYAAGDMGRVEAMVRGALMAETVECPVLGEIGRDRCLTEQKEPFRATSRHRAQLFHACKTCLNRRNQ